MSQLVAEEMEFGWDGILHSLHRGLKNYLKSLNCFLDTWLKFQLFVKSLSGHPICEFCTNVSLDSLAFAWASN